MMDRRLRKLIADKAADEIADLLERLMGEDEFWLKIDGGGHERAWDARQQFEGDASDLIYEMLEEQA